MYKPTASVVASVASVATVATLPQTGASMTISIAIALAAGLVTWAGTYFLMHRIAQ